MTISIPILGQSALGAALAPNSALATGLAGGAGVAQQPDFASLVEAPVRVEPHAVPLEAFDALGMFGRHAALQGGEESPDDLASGDPASAGGLGATTPISPFALPLGAFGAPIAGADDASLPSVSPTLGVNLSAANPQESLQPLVALPPMVPRETASETPETEPAGSAALQKDAAPSRPQPISAAVLLEDGAIQVILRSSETGPDQALALRNRIEDLAREFDLSLDGVRLNGVALPPAASGAAYGRRTN